MAINKAKTSVGTKVVLILLIVAFVASFVSIGANLFSGGPKTQTQSQTAQSPVDQAAAQYQPTVSALTSQLQSNPESYTALVSLGNTYFDWANQVQSASNVPTSALVDNQARWVSAKDAYARALKVKAGESPVTVDYSITQFYTGDTEGAIKTAEGVAKADPTFAPAYFNLGVFYESKGQNAQALAAFQQVVKLDPQGKQSNVAFAKQQITSLQSAPANTQSGTTAP